MEIRWKGNYKIKLIFKKIYIKKILPLLKKNYSFKAYKH